MTPDDLRALPYADYLQTEHWLMMRRLALELAGGRCLLCDSDVEVEVHHRTYERRGYELLRDLVPLCADCHRRHHGTLDETRRRGCEADTELAFLRSELDAELRGAHFLAAQVTEAWRGGIEEGLKRQTERRSA